MGGLVALIVLAFVLFVVVPLALDLIVLVLAAISAFIVAICTAPVRLARKLRRRPVE